jgi:hypothetical protein
MGTVYDVVRQNALAIIAIVQALVQKYHTQ